MAMAFNQARRAEPTDLLRAVIEQAKLDQAAKTQENQAKQANMTGAASLAKMAPDGTYSDMYNAGKEYAGQGMDAAGNWWDKQTAPTDYTDMGQGGQNTDELLNQIDEGTSSADEVLNQIQPVEDVATSDMQTDLLNAVQETEAKQAATEAAADTGAQAGADTAAQELGSQAAQDMISQGSVDLAGQQMGGELTAAGADTLAGLGTDAAATAGTDALAAAGTDALATAGTDAALTAGAEAAATEVAATAAAEGLTAGTGALTGGLASMGPVGWAALAAMALSSIA